MKAEENDPFRWGHSGFKEQNPEEFISTDDEESHAHDVDKVSDEERKKHKRKKHKGHKRKDKHSDDGSIDEEAGDQKHKKRAKIKNSKKVKKTKRRS